MNILNPAPESVGRNRAARFERWLLWWGAIAPFLVTVPKTAEQVESGGFGGIDIARAVIPALCLAVVLLRRGSNKRPRTFGLVGVGLTGFLTWCALSTFWSIDPFPTFAKAATLTVQYLILHELSRRYSTLREAMDSLGTVIHLLLLTVAVTWVLFPAYTLSKAEYETIARLHGTIPRLDANPLATIAVLGLLATILRIGPTWVTRTRFVRAVLGVTYLAELFGTRTRTAIVFAVILLFAVAAREARRTPLTIPLVCFSLVGAMLLLPSQASQLASFLARGQTTAGLSTLTGRTVVWEHALSIWMQQPWKGFGFYSGHRQSGSIGVAEYGNFDNTWLELLVDVGVVGTALLALAVTAAAARAFTDRGQDMQPQTFRLAVITLGLVTSFVNPSLQQTAVVGVVLGFVLLLPKYSRSRQEPSALFGSEGELPSRGGRHGDRSPLQSSV